MPIEDGYSLISKVRNLIQPLKEIPALALTAHASIEALNLALEQGFSTYLTKPFDPDELIQIVSNLAIKHSGLYCQVKDSAALLKTYSLTRGSRKYQY
jgi:CheY-like chemotaxis protein